MKKIAFVLAVLLFAAPAWATVWIDASDLGGGQVEISYITDGNLPRAFGLDITVSAGTITACVPAMVGECNDVLQGYGIFPGTIQIDVGGNVTDDGDPYAPVGATGALGGIDTNGITLEMGSLYTGLNEPAASGLLCTITVTENCTVSIAGNAARCGVGSEAKGVVMEDPDEVPDVNYVPADIILDCFPSGLTAQYAEWQSVGEPDSWCNPRQCHGDADGAQFAGKWVFGPGDLNILIAGWYQDYSGDPSLDGPDADTDPDTWIAADFDHAAFAGKRVFGPGDLNALIAYWYEDIVPDDCLDVP